jgi:hypothetical protein
VFRRRAGEWAGGRTARAGGRQQEERAAPSSEAHIGLFGGKKKSQNKNFDDHITTI